MKGTIPCYCGEEIDVDFPDAYDARADSSVITDILDGTFMSTTCAKCGKTLKPEYACTIHLDLQTSPIMLIPELDRNAFLGGTLETGEAWRVVIGFPELEEKIRIVNDKLDDRVIEMIKLRLLEKAEESDVRIYYREKIGEELILHIHGLKKDEIGISRIPASAYESVSETLHSFEQDEEYGVIIQPPYVSINKVYFEG